ncbi:MAG: electron transport complex subunit RsxC [Oscillospiraceae bacterium]|nr:electron transport complex subunit RsxC [Oscillospiraceae bacterium]
MLRTFKGGIHPDYNKFPQNPETVIPAPDKVIIPLVQHIGAACEPIVAVGDYVKMGQKIGDSSAPISAPVHASVSGKVIAIEKRKHPLGNEVMSVVIENDHQDTLCTDMAPLTEDELKDGEKILQRIREAGIVGMGGAAFPTAFKLQSGLGKVDTLIINGAECEPYLNGDHLTMLNHPRKLLMGIELARIACGLDKAYYGIEVNKQDAIDLLKSYDPAQYGVEIVPEKVKYPQGAERLQVYAITGRRVKAGGLPSGVGCNVISTRTAYSIYKACYEGVLAIERIVSIAGSAVKTRVNALTRVGTPFSHIVEHCGGFVEKPRKIVLGGPLMGICASSLECPTIKGISGLLFFTKKEEKKVADPNCIRCGRCIQACPMRLEPIFMYMYYRRGDYDTMDKYHVNDCFECGCCSYVCPARLPLTHSFRVAKNVLWERQQEKAKKEAK